jgi:thymidylate synthase
MHADKVYFNLCNTVLNEGVARTDRTGTGTLSVFGHQMRFNLQEGFPLLTTKKMFFNGVMDELFWFIQGGNIDNTSYKRRMNLNDLPTRSHNLWKWWAKEDGDLGRIYGAQWREWNHKDQLQTVINNIISDPFSRRHIVSSWNVDDLNDMALPPCHVLFQFYVVGNRLSCQLYQRSGDVFLGIPFNIASYALLTHIVARATNLEVGDFIHTIGDAHIYTNHLDQIKSQIDREPFPMPTIEVADRGSNVNAYGIQDITLRGYTCHPAIKGSVSV